MFCQQCGNNVPEGSAFCPVCGASAQPQAAPAPQAYAAPQGYAAPAPQYAAPAQQPYPQQGYAPVQQPYPQQGYAPAQPGYPQQPYYPAAPAQPSAMSKAFAAFTAVLKGVFSKDVVKTVGNQAKSTGMEWLIGIIISVLTFALATPINVLEGISQMVRKVGGGLGGMVLKYIRFPFFSFFGASLLIGILVLAALTVGVWLVAKLVSKKEVPFTCALNLVGAATLPLSICYAANMLLGLIWVPLAIAVSIIAMIMTLILLYVGFQKLEKPVVSPFYPYAALTAVVVIVAVLMGFLLYKAVITGWVGNIAGNALGGLGGLGGLGDLGDLFG